VRRSRANWEVEEEIHRGDTDENNPLLEGIVLKRADSPLVAKADNPFWYKVKYRDIHEPTKF